MRVSGGPDILLTRISKSRMCWQDLTASGRGPVSWLLEIHTTSSKDSGARPSGRDPAGKKNMYTTTTAKPFRSMLTFEPNFQTSGYRIWQILALSVTPLLWTLSRYTVLRTQCRNESPQFSRCPGIVALTLHPPRKRTPLHLFCHPPPEVSQVEFQAKTNHATWAMCRATQCHYDPAEKGSRIYRQILCSVALFFFCGGGGGKQVPEQVGVWFSFSLFFFKKNSNEK